MATRLLDSSDGPQGFGVVLRLFVHLPNSLDSPTQNSKVHVSSVAIASRRLYCGLLMQHKTCESTVLFECSVGSIPWVYCTS